MSDQCATVDQVPTLQRHAERLLGVVQPAAHGARGVKSFFGGLAVASALAGIVLFLLLFLPFDAPSVWKVALWTLAAALLVLPGAVLGLFRMGLSQLIGMPGELAESIGEVERRGLGAVRSSVSTPADGGRLRRLIRFVRSLVDVRTALLQSKELAVKASLLIRLANPITLVVVLGSVVAAVLVVVVTCAAAVTMALL